MKTIYCNTFFLLSTTVVCFRVIEFLFPLSPFFPFVFGHTLRNNKPGLFSCAKVEKGKKEEEEEEEGPLFFRSRRRRRKGKKRKSSFYVLSPFLCPLASKNADSPNKIGRPIFLKKLQKNKSSGLSGQGRKRADIYLRSFLSILAVARRRLPVLHLGVSGEPDTDGEGGRGRGEEEEEEDDDDREEEEEEEEGHPSKTKGKKGRKKEGDTAEREGRVGGGSRRRRCIHRCATPPKKSPQVAESSSLPGEVIVVVCSHPHRFLNWRISRTTQPTLERCL